ncbi:MAG: acyltransferase [Bacteroidetes bacterium]|nr:acyltransferase [Bacteroidota bacterium]
MPPTSKRLRELDFLRGLAIILVLFRHQYLFEFTKRMGWIGVDLFFVLSGFLVSGLLFKEYLKHGDIKPGRFLIRRGFKIYPLYYLSVLPYLLPILYFEDFKAMAFLSDLVLFQNYVHGLGYINPPSWSLAVEEHFYLGLALLMWFGLKHKLINLKEAVSGKSNRFPTIILMLMAISLCFRIVTNLMLSADPAESLSLTTQNFRSFTMTHLRIDSLLAGVLLAYYYYFRFEWLCKIFNSYKERLFAVAVLGVCWTPFIEPEWSVFVKTIGFTLLYISFGVLLLAFLMIRDINRKLDTLSSSKMVDGISKIGFCSYAIYLVHWLVNYSVNFMNGYFKLHISHYAIFMLTTSISIMLGMWMTYKLERHFLRFRDKHFPNRVLKPSSGRVISTAPIA